MPNEETSKELGPFQLALVVLSVVLLVGLAVDFIVRVPHEIGRLIFFVDTAICGMLLVDFLWRFARAPAKWRFMQWGWLDLLACVPAVPALRWGRLFRIVRVIKLVLALRSYRALLAQFVHKRRQAGLASALVLTVFVICFASIGVLLFENDPASNIKTAEDALWWAMVTITTIGYGDRYPVTDAGRLIATVLMVSGIGLFGTLSGVAASFFLGTADKATDEPKLPAEAIASLEERVTRLERKARE
ncbi:MAG: potassium channel family protein [Opitutaceae bacterium]|nr:potassium channel family protein [Opitutaceae bacterium]